MDGGEFGALGRSSPALAEIAAEMGEIFDRAGLGLGIDARPRSAALAAVRPSRRGRRPAGALLIAAVAGLLGLAAGALVIRSAGSPVPSVSRLAAQSVPLQRKAASQPLPKPPASPPVALAEATPPLGVQPLPDQAPPSAKPHVRDPGSPVAARSASRPRTRFELKLDRLGAPAPAYAAPPIRQTDPPIRQAAQAPEAERAGCDSNGDGEDCNRAVAQADRRLRAAYEAAVERGVSRRVLVDYRDRWTDLRDRDDQTPTRLIAGYGALAYDLQRERPDDRGEAPRPDGRSGLRALKDLLVPWW